MTGASRLTVTESKCQGVLYNPCQVSMISNNWNSTSHEGPMQIHVRRACSHHCVLPMDIHATPFGAGNCKSGQRNCAAEHWLFSGTLNMGIPMGIDQTTRQCKSASLCSQSIQMGSPTPPSTSSFATCFLILSV